MADETIVKRPHNGGSQEKIKRNQLILELLARGHTQRQVAGMLNVSQMVVWRISKRAKQSHTPEPAGTAAGL